VEGGDDVQELPKFSTVAPVAKNPYKPGVERNPIARLLIA